MHAKSFFANILHIENAVLNRKLADISGELQLSKGDFLIREGEKQTQFIFCWKGFCVASFWMQEAAKSRIALALYAGHRVCHALLTMNPRQSASKRLQNANCSAFPAIN